MPAIGMIPGAAVRILAACPAQPPMAEATIARACSWMAAR
jgi:hypothetical protein